MSYAQGIQESTPTPALSVCLPVQVNKESSETSQTCLSQSILAILCEEGRQYQKRQRKQI